MSNAPRDARAVVLPNGAVACSPSELAMLGLHAVPTGLVGSAWAERLLALPSPGRCLTYGAFECRLDGDDRVDFLACAPTDDGGDRLTAGCIDASDAGLSTPFRVLAEWAHPGPLNAAASTVWLEYDVPRDAPGSAAQPFAFVRLVPKPWGPPPPGQPTPTEVAVAALARVHGLGELRTDALQRCERQLPFRGQMCHVAVLPHRGIRDLRIHIGLPHVALPRYLDAIGWPGDMALVRELLPAWRDGLEVAGFQLDVGDSVRAGLGLEFFLETNPRDDPRWTAFLALARATGRCDVAKLDAIARWPGTGLDVATIPRAAKRGERGATNAKVVRTLLVKVALLANGEMAVKAYLAFTPRTGPGA